MRESIQLSWDKQSGTTRAARSLLAILAVLIYPGGLFFIVRRWWFVNEYGKTFTHERGRINISGINFNVYGVPLRSTNLLKNLNIVKISPKLRGYQFGSVTKISLRLLTFDTNGNFSGYLCSYDGSTYTKIGPTIYGKKGELTRFYDETNIDYIDIIFNIIINNL